MFNKIKCLSITLSFFLTSCTTAMQQSSSLNDSYLINNQGKAAVRGIPYYLPDTIIPIKITGDFQVLPDRKPKDSKTNPNPEDYEYVLTLTIGETKQVPDPNARMLLEYHLEPGSNDEFRLNVSKNGLLSNVKSLSEDKSGEVAIKLAELAKYVAEIVAFDGDIPSKEYLDKLKHKIEQTEDERRKACFDQLKKISIEFNINLSSLLESSNKENLVATLKDELNQKIIKAMKMDDVISKNGSYLISDINISNKVFIAKPSQNAPKFEEGKKGIIFRIMEPANLKLTLDTSHLTFSKNSKDCSLPKMLEATDALPVFVANPFKTYVVDTSRGALVKKRVDLIINEGVLTGIEIDKPSELLAGISIPIEILKTIASIPGEILSLRIKGMEAQKSMTQTEAEIIKQQIEVIRQRQELNELTNR